MGVASGSVRPFHPSRESLCGPQGTRVIPGGYAEKAAHRSAAIACGARPVPFRTRKLSRTAPMVLRGKPVGEQGAADRWTAFRVSPRKVKDEGPREGPFFYIKAFFAWTIELGSMSRAYAGLLVLATVSKDLIGISFQYSGDSKPLGSGGLFYS